MMADTELATALGAASIKADRVGIVFSMREIYAVEFDVSKCESLERLDKITATAEGSAPS